MKYILIILFLLFNVTLCFSQNKPTRKIKVFRPTFSTYKADSIYNGKPAKLDFNTNPKMKLFRTAIREGYKKSKLNFAGHYCFVYWGCGSECQDGAIIDLKNGKIYDGLTASLRYEFRRNSRMVIVNPLNKDGDIDHFCSMCKPEVWVLNEATKKFTQRRVRFSSPYYGK